MTSNLRTEEDVRAAFRPELVNRIDEIIVFAPLERAHLERIVEIQLGRLRTMLAERDLALRLEDGARALLVERGWDPVYGARPLKRAIQRLVATRSVAILRGDFSVPGDATSPPRKGTRSPSATRRSRSPRRN